MVMVAGVFLLSALLIKMVGKEVDVE
jgi:hypothetical protein